MTEIDYDDGNWNEPLDGERITVACVRCGAPVVAEYDRGEPMTRWHPGAPAEWVPIEDTCGHPEEYTSEEEDSFHDAIDRATYAMEG